MSEKAHGEQPPPNPALDILLAQLYDCHQTSRIHEAYWAREDEMQHPCRMFTYMQLGEAGLPHKDIRTTQIYPDLPLPSFVYMHILQLILTSFLPRK
jgi:hypothetical protein